MDLNRVEIIGRLTKDPEVRQTPTGQTVVSFTVATNYVRKNATGEKIEQAEFHNCVAWSGLAETISKYLRKGSRGFFAGRLQTRNWEDPEGKKHYKTEIVVSEMLMLDTKSGGGDSSFSRPSDNVQEQSSGGDFIPDEEPKVTIEDVPF